MVGKSGVALFLVSHLCARFVMFLACVCVCDQAGKHSSMRSDWKKEKEGEREREREGEEERGEGENKETRGKSYHEKAFPCDG